MTRRWKWRRPGEAPHVLPLLLAASVALAAQDPSPPEQLQPFRTEVNYIRVDMYPTADNKPVMDLRPEEVKIFDEGVPQKLDPFEHVRARRAIAGHAPRAVDAGRNARGDAGCAGASVRAVPRH